MNIFKIIALVGLFLTALGPILAFAGPMEVSTNKGLMIFGMILWFAGATPWIGGKALRPADTEVEI
jgi:hypothetical protein